MVTIAESDDRHQEQGKQFTFSNADRKRCRLHPQRSYQHRKTVGTEGVAQII